MTDLFGGWCCIGVDDPFGGVMYYKGLSNGGDRSIREGALVGLKSVGSAGQF